MLKRQAKQRQTLMLGGWCCDSCPSWWAAVGQVGLCGVGISEDWPVVAPLFDLAPLFAEGLKSAQEQGLESLEQV